MSPRPPSRMSTMATRKYMNGLRLFRIAIAMKSPMALEPASPIRSLLGVALYQRYPRIHTLNKRMVYVNGSATSSMTRSITNMVMRVMMVRVPERPSTPSEQFVTLMDAHTRIMVSMANTMGGSVTELPKIAKVTVDEL